MFHLGVTYRIGQGVRRSPSAAIDWYFRAGQAYIKDNKRDEALTAYDRIVALDPNHPLAAELRQAIYGKPPAAVQEDKQ